MELFSNINTEIKQAIQTLVDTAIASSNFLEAQKILIQTKQLLNSDEDRQFMDFYFQLKLEELNHNGDSNSN